MWIWTGGDKGGKGGKGGGKSGGRPPNLGKGAQPNRRHYIQCNTTGCNGHVFQVHGKEMPEKCKVCNLCGIPFVIPILPAIGAGSKGNAGKGGSQNPIKKKKEEDAAAAAPSPLSAAASVAPGKITDFFENLKEHGYSEEAALEQLTALGLKLPKKVLPKTVDEYDRLASINREIKRCQNDISGQSEKYYRLEQATEDLLNTILEKQLKLADLKAEQVALHQSITKASPTVKSEHDKTSLNAVLQAELDHLSVMTTYIESQPNVPEQVKQLCSRVEYVKMLTQKTFHTQFETTEAFEYAAGLVEITSDDLKKVGEEDYDDSVWPDGFEVVDLDQAMGDDGQPQGELATANVVSCSTAGGKGNTTPPPSNSETEYPSYNMANWSQIKKKASGLDMPRPAKVPKSSGSGLGTQAPKTSVAE